MMNSTRVTHRSHMLIAMMCLVGHVVAADELVGPQWRVRSDDKSTSARLVANNHGALRLSNGMALRDVERLETAIEPVEILPPSPFHEIQLVNGDRLTTSITKGQPDRADWSVANGSPLPTAWVKSLKPTPGYQSFALRPDGLKDSRGDETPVRFEFSNRVRFQLPRVLNVGQLMWWLPRPRSNDEWRVQFELEESQEPLLLVLKAGSNADQEVTIATIDGHAPVRAVGPEVCVRVMSQEGRWQVVAGHQIVAQYRNALRLTAFQVARSAKSDERTEMRPPSVQYSFAATPELPIYDERLDALQVGRDELLFGKIRSIGLDALTVEVRQQQRRIPFHELTSVRFSAADRAVESSWIDGPICRVRLQGQRLGPNQVARDELQVVVDSADGDGLGLTHVSGWKLRLPWSLIQSLEPLTQGKSRYIAIGRRHLGNSVQAHFERPQPDGIAWKIKLPESIPEGSLFVSMDVMDLIPAGQQALGGTSHLADIRAGHLSLRLFINNRDIGSVNEYVSEINSIAEPVRAVIPLPRKLLRSGKNELTLSQTPANSNAVQFDDCEVRHVMLEVR